MPAPGAQGRVLHAPRTGKAADEFSSSSSSTTDTSTAIAEEAAHAFHTPLPVRHRKVCLRAGTVPPCVEVHRDNRMEGGLSDWPPPPHTSSLSSGPFFPWVFSGGRGCCWGCLSLSLSLCTLIRLHVNTSLCSVEHMRCLAIIPPPQQQSLHTTAHATALTCTSFNLVQGRVRQSGLSNHCAWGNAVVPAEPSCTRQLVSSWPLVLQFAIATALWDWPHSLARVVAAEAWGGLHSVPS